MTNVECIACGGVRRYIFQADNIEQKIRKIQDLFLDQIEIRLSTSTEIDEKVLNIIIGCVMHFMKMIIFMIMI